MMKNFKKIALVFIGTTSVIAKGESFFVQANKIQYLNNVYTEIGVKYA